MISVGITSPPAGPAGHLFEAPTQMKIKYSSGESKISLQQAAFNKERARLAFSCPLKALLLQMQKGQASQQILPSTLASMFHWQTGLWKRALKAKSNSTGNKKVSDPELDLHGRF